MLRVDSPRNPGLLRNITIAIVAGAVVYALITLFVPKQYESYTSLYFPQSQQVMPSNLAALAQGGSGADAATVRSLNGAVLSPLVGSGPQTATAIARSRSCLEFVVKELQLEKKWDAPLHKAVDKLSKRVGAETDRNGMLVLTAKGDSPDQAVQVLWKVLEHLRTTSKGVTLNVSRKNREFIESRVASAEDDVERVREHAVAVIRSAPYANVEQIARMYAEAKRGLDDARVREGAAKAKLASFQKDYQRMLSDRSGDGIVQLAALNESIGELAKQANARRLALLDAVSRFAEASPELKQAREASENAERLSSQMVASARQNVQEGTLPALTEAKSEVEALTTALRASETIMKEYEQIAREAARHYTAVEEVKASLQAALQQRTVLLGEAEMARIAEERDPTRFELIDRPYPFPEPVSPRRGMLSALFTLVVLGGLSYPWLRERLSATP